ncbi:hypothetical protein E4U41_001331 [Claviceps citrina]|nr:hypothetical protein E4U41_001331 [Claviceps citrina]
MTADDTKGKGSQFYDIVVVGAGPVGLMLSTCLARWGYHIKHIDNRPEPTGTGRADGIQPRSLDLLRNMGLKAEIMAHKPARVYEVAFWNPDRSGSGIVRTGTWASCPSFIDTRYPFTTLLHQGHIERVFIHDLESSGVQVQRPWTLQAFESNENENPDFPVYVELKHLDGTEVETMRAKYLFGGDGARSFVRQQLNIPLKHIDPVEHIWGVIDGVVKTDFPDIQMKCTIHSHHGSIMVIPREENMVRLYVQIASSNEPHWNHRKSATQQQVQESAKEILHPYLIEWERVEWYSVYPIGQGISDRYSLDQRVFLGGDACHTHSPKAGQGMNMAFSDALNLAWKIHAVEGGLAHRELLKTYELERKGVAESLLNFDNRYAKLFSQRPPATREVEAVLSNSLDNHMDEKEDEFVKVFKESCEFTSGYGVSYGPNSVNWSQSHPATSSLMQPKGTTLRTGHIFVSSTVTRVVDANVVHLEQEIPLNGSFRIFVFAGNPSDTKIALGDLERGIGRKGSFYSSYIRADVDTVSHHERHNPHSLFFTICIIFAAKRAQIEISREVPGLLARYRNHVYADDQWDRRVPSAKASAHARMGFDQSKGAIAVVRPDGYVGAIMALVEGHGTTLNAVSTRREVDSRGSSSVGEFADRVLESLDYEHFGNHANHNHDTGRDLAFATVNEVNVVAPFPDASSSRNFKPSQRVPGAYPVNESEALEPKIRVTPRSAAFTASDLLAKYANRPRNVRRPKLPRFPKLRRRLPLQIPQVQASSDLTQVLNQRPKSTSFPKQRYLIDTSYPRLFDSDKRLVDIRYALRSLSAQRPKVSSSPPVASSPPKSTSPRPLPNNAPLFVEFHGICTNKRHAEDFEVDLVAALHHKQGETLVSCITTSRSPYTSDSELEYQAKDQQHMCFPPVSGRITGIMNNVLISLSDIGSWFSRHLYNRPYAVSETKSYVAIPESNEIDVASKRRKIASAGSEFEWLDQNGLKLLISRYEQLRYCFDKSCDVVRRWTKAGIHAHLNEVLKPLLPILAANEDDLKKLQSGQPGYDLPTLYLLHCQQMFRFLDTLYEIGIFVKTRDKYATVPRTFDYHLNNETRATVLRIKNFMAAPEMLNALDQLFNGAHCRWEEYNIPFDLIGYVALDMAAVEHNMIVPSYIKSNYLHKQMLDELLPPDLKALTLDGVPGTFPKDQTREPAISPPSTPPPRIAKADCTKTGHVKASLLTAEASQLTPSSFRAKFHGQDETYKLIKESYITDFEAKKPLKKDEILAVKSILKDRKAPKRLTMRLAPKSVRFTENTLSPRQRTHLGFNVPKLPRAAKTGSRRDTDDFKFIFPRRKSDLLEKKQLDDEEVDPSAAIDEILSLPSPLVISDDTKSDIALEKERAAQKAAEEAKRRAEEQARKEAEERFARSGGLRIPVQPLVAPLSSDWLSRAQATLHASATTTLATTAEGVELRRHDFAKIVPATEWLNDEIVNGSLNWLDQSINMAAGIKDVKRNTRKCLAMSSFFFKRLQEQGVTRTQRTLRRCGVDKKNLLNVDTVLLPICEHSHWTLMVIRPSKKTIAHMDSLNPTGSQQYIKLCLAWLKDIMEDQYVESEWKIVQHEAPQQTNGHDCGVHTITNGMCVALGLNPIDSYAADDMPRQRLRIASMLLNGGFKGDFDLGRY